MIPGFWDQAPRRTPCSVGSLLLLLPAGPPACASSLSLSLSDIKKKKKILKKTTTHVKSGQE